MKKSWYFAIKCTRVIRNLFRLFQIPVPNFTHPKTPNLLPLTNIISKASQFVPNKVILIAVLKLKSVLAGITLFE